MNPAVREHVRRRVAIVVVIEMRRGVIAGGEIAMIVEMTGDVIAGGEIAMIVEMTGDVIAGEGVATSEDEYSGDATLCCGRNSKAISHGV